MPETSTITTPTDGPSAVAADSSVATGPLTELTTALVRHLADEVVVFRELQHRLDDDNLSEPELRRALGQLFDESLDGYAIARGFHDSIATLESNAGVVTADGLVANDSVVVALTGWLDDLQLATDVVAADLVGIEALVGVIEHRHDHDAATRSAMESIKSLAYNAIGRLDEARPPHRERPGFRGVPDGAPRSL